MITVCNFVIVLIHLSEKILNNKFLFSIIKKRFFKDRLGYILKNLVECLCTYMYV